jgi:hypothetical protein
VERAAAALPPLKNGRFIFLSVPLSQFNYLIGSMNRVNHQRLNNISLNGLNGLSSDGLSGESLNRHGSEAGYAGQPWLVWGC